MLNAVHIMKKRKKTIIAFLVATMAGIVLWNLANIERRFVKIEDSKSWLPYLPDHIFSIPFCGNVEIEKRKFNDSITISGVVDITNKDTLWLSELLRQPDSAVRDMIAMSSKESVTITLRNVKLEDKRGCPMEQKTKIELKNTRCELYIEFFYPNNR
jgi:hypothetical protein